MAKGPRILGIKHWPWDHQSEFAVTITTRQANRVPDWVKIHMKEYDQENGYTDVLIQAKDELEAMMRFKKLWAGLPKKGE